MVCVSGTTASRHPRYIVSTRNSFCGGCGTGPLHKLCSLDIRTARICRGTERTIQGFVNTRGDGRVVFAEGAARDLGLITCDCKLSGIGGNSRVIISVVRRRDSLLP